MIDWVFSKLYSARRKESFLLACKVICPNLHFCFLSPRKISFLKPYTFFFIRQANAGKADCTYCQGYSCATSQFHFATIRFSSKFWIQNWRKEVCVNWFLTLSHTVTTTNSVMTFFGCNVFLSIGLFQTILYASWAAWFSGITK